MLYHRLLSSLLSTADPSIPSASPLDFDLLWVRASVDPYRRFSDTFLQQTGLASAAEHDPGLADMSCLHDLAAAWHQAVPALAVASVDDTLTLVYRMQPSRRRPKRRGKGKEKDKEGKGDAPVSDQEARDIAAAIQASISDVQPGHGGDDDLARAIFESLKDSLQSGATADGELGVLTHPFGPPIDALASSGAGGDSDSGGGTGGAHDGVSESVGAGGALSADPQLAWALQQSLLETPTFKEVIAQSTDGKPLAVEERPSEGVNVDMVVEPVHADPSAKGMERKPESPAECDTADVDAPKTTTPDTEDESTDEEITAAELDTEAQILGTKEFKLDDAVLDEYLTRVLAWWYGRRPAQGVDVELTRRCV